MISFERIFSFIAYIVTIMQQTTILTIGGIDITVFESVVGTTVIIAVVRLISVVTGVSFTDDEMNDIVEKIQKEEDY